MFGGVHSDVVDDHEERALPAFRDEVEELILRQATVRRMVHELDLGTEAFLRNLEDGGDDRFLRFLI